VFGSVEDYPSKASFSPLLGGSPEREQGGVLPVYRNGTRRAQRAESRGLSFGSESS